LFNVAIKECGEPTRELIVLGAGSAAELILEHVNISGNYKIKYFVDYNDFPHRSHLFDVEVLGFNQLDELRNFGYENIFIHLPSGKKTLEAMEYCLKRGFRLINVIHPTASISTTSVMGLNNLIGPYVVIGPYVTIGDSVSVLNCASVAHHSKIGNGARISDGARVAGNVKISDFVLLGLNSTVNARISIEKEITVLSGRSVYESLKTPGTNY
jgi:NDP-sugar pyrophosphorylase family protein